jgi:hypothetical protein
VVIHLLGMGFALGAGPCSRSWAARSSWRCAHGCTGRAVAVPTEIPGVGAGASRGCSWFYASRNAFLPPNLFVLSPSWRHFSAPRSGRSSRARERGVVRGSGVAANVIFGEYVPYLIFLAFGEAMLTAWR